MMQCEHRIVTVEKLQYYPLFFFIRDNLKICFFHFHFNNRMKQENKFVQQPHVYTLLLLFINQISGDYSLTTDATYIVQTFSGIQFRYSSVAVFTLFFDYLIWEYQQTCNMKRYNRSKQFFPLKFEN